MERSADQRAEALSASRSIDSAARGIHDAAESDGTLSRRGLLRTVGGAAAGAVALGLVTARPAAAANGGNMVLGTANEAASQTRLYNTTETTNLNFYNLGQLRVDGTGNSARGVLAYGPVNGNGAVGTAIGTGSFGVIGASDSGVGVAGSSNTGVDFFAINSGRVRLTPTFRAVPRRAAPIRRARSCATATGTSGCAPLAVPRGRSASSPWPARPVSAHSTSSRLRRGSATPSTGPA